MGFNKAQNEAIMHGKGPCQVLAGPGSGKTLTIVNRIKYLIERYEVRPEEILVVTFTRFAAAEMKSRLCSLMGKSNVPVTAGTFHGIYYGILKWAYRLMDLVPAIFCQKKKNIEFFEEYRKIAEQRRQRKKIFCMILRKKSDL